MDEYNKSPNSEGFENTPINQSDSSGIEKPQTPIDHSGWSASDNNKYTPPQNTFSGYNVQPPQGGTPPAYQNYSSHAPNPQKSSDYYRWNFDEYSPDNNGGNGFKEPPKKKRVGMTIAMVLMSIFAVFTIGFAAYGVYEAFSGADNQTASRSSQPLQSQPESSTSSPDNTTSHSLPIIDKPDVDSQDQLGEGTLTPEEVSSIVKPTVVSVVVYEGNSISPISQGSGIIISEDGYIVTNAHVVEYDTTLINIILDNDEEYEGVIVGSDPRSDLAVLKIDADNLSFATFGNSDQLNVGEYVLAIGNPGGVQFSGSVTLGIVSALNRTILSENSYSMEVIQTDAAINPGNSGGALVNMHGQIIGINSAKIALTDYEGLGFAIPSNNAKPIIDSLIENGYVKDRVKLGVTLQQISPQVAEAYDVPVGLQIASIQSDSNLLQKGVRAFDIITHLDDESVESTSELFNILSKYKPGDNVTITLYRRSSSGSGGSSFDINVILQEDPGN